MSVRLSGQAHFSRQNLADVGRLYDATREHKFQWTRPVMYIAGAFLCTCAVGYGVHSWRKTRRQIQLGCLKNVMAAVRDGDVFKLEKTLKTCSTDLNEVVDGELALIVAVHVGDAAIVTQLLEAGASPNATVAGDTTALMAACTLGRAEIVTMLVKAGADPLLTDETGFNATHMAARMGHLDCLREVVIAAPLTADAKRMSDGASPLMLAAAENHVCLRTVLCLNAGVNSFACRFTSYVGWAVAT
jgi:hypothetical protein